MKKKPRRFVIWNLRGCPLIFCYDIVTVRRLKRNDFAKKRRRSALCRMPACDRYDFCRKPPCKIIKTCRRRTKESRKQTCRRARAPEGSQNAERPGAGARGSYKQTPEAHHLPTARSGAPSRGQCDFPWPGHRL